MKKISRLDEIRQATAAAIDTYRARQEQLTSEHPHPPQPGDVYLFPGPFATDLVWGVIGSHPDQPLSFAVPADAHPLVGLTDVEVAASKSYDRLVLRCGYGLWIHREEFRMDWRVATLAGRYVHRAQEKLKEIAAGKIQGSASQRESEANPDYEEWLAQVESDADRLANALRTKEENLTAADFKQSLVVPSTDADSADAETHFALAAASSAPLAHLYEAIQEESTDLPPTKPVDFLYPGSLFLVLESGGVGVVYTPQGDRPPPVLHCLDEGAGERPASWVPTPRRTAWRASFVWDSQRRVRLRFGQADYSREITVQK
jgi:hypothetical protein